MGCTDHHYLPELQFQSDATLAKRLTLIDLLSYQTGLLRLDALWLGANNEVNIPKNYTITVCNHLASAYSLRSKWLYNNWMYALTGEIIERVTNLPWGEVLASRVLDKIGLSHTAVIKSHIPKDKTALPYIISDEKRPLRIGDLDLTDESLMASVGGIRSTVPDMLAWGNALLSIFQDEPAPIELVDNILSGHSFMNKSAISDEHYTLGFVKVTTPTQFGKIGFNPGLIDGMPTLGTDSEPQRVFYHHGAIPGYSHCFMLIPGHQAVIVVLTNSISQGDIADWVAQTLLQAVLDVKSPLNLTSHAEQAASKWKTMYNTIDATLKKERTPNTPEAPHKDFIGSYRHKTGALSIEVFGRKGTLKFSINGKPSQTHTLRHYHYDSFVFLPSAEERSARGLFLYSTPAWLLNFERNVEGKVGRIIWNIDSLASKGEIFTKSEAQQE
jgi:CubicO group peptidase (beta-lactamase class C family)